MEIKNRHDIDLEVFGFVVSKLSKTFNDPDFNVNANSYDYQYKDDDIKITISKRDILRLDSKVRVSFGKKSTEESGSPLIPSYGYDNYLVHLFSIETSNLIRKFIEDNEDKINEDFIRNNSNDILNFIKDNQ